MAFRDGFGVTFGNVHSARDLNLMMPEHPEIGEAEPVLRLDEIPGRNGALDQSEAAVGRIVYRPRELGFSFCLRDKGESWPYRYSEVQKAIHGKRMRITLDDDRWYYYEGRVEVDALKSSKRLGKIAVKATVDPYKYELCSSLEPWLWDPFDFRTGVIRNYGRLKADGTLDAENSKQVNVSAQLTVIGSEMPVCPTFYAQSTDGHGLILNVDGTPLADRNLYLTGEGGAVIEGPQPSPVSVETGDVDFDWQTGAIRFPDLILENREYTFYFSGNGAVAVGIRGGRL